jgi:hypothetical protein
MILQMLLMSRYLIQIFGGKMLKKTKKIIIILLNYMIKIKVKKVKMIVQIVEVYILEEIAL